MSPPDGGGDFMTSYLICFRPKETLTQKKGLERKESVLHKLKSSPLRRETNRKWYSFFTLKC